MGEEIGNAEIGTLPFPSSASCGTRLCGVANATAPLLVLAEYCTLT